MNMKRNKFRELSQQALDDIKRIGEIWSYCRKISGSTKYLFQDFTIADAFFAPIVSRIVSYQIKIEGHDDYIKTICNNEFYQAWYSEALNEKWIMSDIDNS
jgi:glutathione S-transferase